MSIYGNHIKRKEKVEARQEHRNNKESAVNWSSTTKNSRIKLRKIY
jgi:hypothetical protein